MVFVLLGIKITLDKVRRLLMKMVPVLVMALVRPRAALLLDRTFYGW